MDQRSTKYHEQFCFVLFSVVSWIVPFLRINLLQLKVSHALNARWDHLSLR
jgi:hypothetical protein